MFKVLLALFRPLHEIAKDLRILRELYELDLGSRNPPLYRVTEKPSKHDTEVVEDVDMRPLWKRWLREAPDDDDEGNW